MPDLEGLKKTWQSQSGISQERFDAIGLKVKGSSERLQATILRRDLRESLASVIVVLCFFPALFFAKNWIDWTGYAIEVILGISLPFVLWWARRRPPAEANAASFRDFVDVEIDYLSRQVQLLRMVATVYLVPLYLGIVLISVVVTAPGRSPFALIFVTVYLICCAAFCLFVAWLNRSARIKHLQPWLDYYLEMRKALDSDDDSAMPSTGPPAAFLDSHPRRPMSRRRRRVWIALTIAAMLLVAGAGLATMHFFDARAGGFVISMAPVVALLFVVATGVWRRPSG